MNERPLSIREALELLDAMAADPKALSIYAAIELLAHEPDASTIQSHFTLDTARALDYYGYIEFESRMGNWHSPSAGRNAVDGSVEDLWNRKRPMRLSEKGRGRLAAFRVPME